MSEEIEEVREEVVEEAPIASQKEGEEKDSREADLAAREAEVAEKEEKIEKASQLYWGNATGGLIIWQD
jgi:hypothetical protein|tara:strand:+ start:1919 stop:2125 length:207 start_codon:yes stop_codon:yes gene_type:complete